jgi:hypothetical protein
LLSYLPRDNIQGFILNCVLRLVSTSLSAILGRIKEESIDAALAPAAEDPLARELSTSGIPETIGRASDPVF